MTFRKPSHSLRTNLNRNSGLQPSGSNPSAASSRMGSKRRQKKRRDEKRRSLLESLETRQLLAGPELIGIQPNEGDLLFNGDTLNFSPKELVFRFDDNTRIDQATLDAIRITRAGEDGVFESALVTSDLGTEGQALFEFRARQSGSLGNGITIKFESESRINGPAPVITTSAADRTVTININTNPLQRTKARDLISAVNSDPNASALIEAIQVSGPSGQVIGVSNIDDTTLVLDGANAAQAVTDFGSNGDVRVRFISQLPGLDGRGIRLNIEQRNFGGPANPVVVVTDKTIRVQLNSFFAQPNTAADLIQAINSNPQASQLVTAVVQEGDANTTIGNLPTVYSPIILSGVSDVFVEPGYVGLGDSPREVVFRFAEPLPDDSYQIDVLGTGAFALRGEDGEAFQDGTDLTRLFNINLGPRVVAVVPEPVRRRPNGSISTDTGIIEVHFNDDDLSPSQAENEDFYQLIFTRDTVDNTDDVIVRLTPGSVSYNSITNIATLDYQRALSRIPDPDNPGQLLSGNARLRVGTSEDLPTAPQEINLPIGTTGAPDGAGDSFDTAFDLNSNWTLSGATTTQSATLSTEIRNETPFGLDLPGPDVPGTRTIRPEDPSRLDRVVPLDYVRQFADTIDGITTIEYDFVASWLGDDPNRPNITPDTNYFNIISEQQKQRVREVMSLYSEYLGVSFVEVADRDPDDISGFSIAVGDLYGGDEREASAAGGLAVVTRDRNGDGVDDLVVMDFQDFDESVDDQFGGEFFRGAMFGVGQLLGYGYADDLPQPVTQSTDFIFQPGTDNEPAFPSYADIVHGQYLYRPDSTDIDMYRFEVEQAGSVSIETIAERLGTPSLLDTQLRLYVQDSTGGFVEIAQNDDYFSNDSLIRLENINPGVYMIGVSAKGNDSYDPAIPGTGFGGLSQGDYELRVDFTPSAVNQMTDNTGIPLDGDADGRPGGTFNYWFKPSDPSETLFVDKGNVTERQSTGLISPNLGDLDFIDAFKTRIIGYANNAYDEIDRALADAGRISTLKQQAADGSLAELNQLKLTDPVAAANVENYLESLDLTIRVIGNGGQDGLVQTPSDNFSYNIGFANNGTPLEDGSELNLPADVQMMIESGAILKFSNARLGVGSVAPTIDLSGANLQVLGTPTIVTSTGLPARDSTGAIVPGSVILTSVNDATVGTGNQIGLLPAPQPGDWGGIDFRGDLDAADELRPNFEDQGVFANHIQYADMRYGGGAVAIGGRDVVISPIDMAITRPTIINSTFNNSADAAIAATPDTFREDRFTDPRYQQGGRFTPDYTRVGPEIHGNSLHDNSINGLFVRLRTRSGDDLESVTTSTRFDDSDIPHVLTENLVIAGTPGGPIVQSDAPSSFLIRLSESPLDGAIPAGTYQYRVTNVSDANLESAASDATVTITTAASTSGIRLQQLPTVEPGSATVARRLYRATVDPITGNPGPFRLVAQINASSTTFTDRVEVGGRELQLSASPLRSRLDASLVIDPSTVVKIDSARIETRFGANLIAEGTPGNPVVITSLEDQRYGGGGTFDTNDRGDAAELNPGDWGGIYIGHGASASIDHAVIAGGGGTTRIEGGFASFNAIEVHQGDLRLTNSRVEHSADGRGALNGTRVGRSDNAPGAVFVRAATPIIVGNDFIDNDAPAISVDVNSLNSQEVFDQGRATGVLGGFDIVGNSGPLVQDNSLTRNGINGMVVRGGQLVTEGVWDDVDIVHVVNDSIEIPNKHIFGGLRLISDARGSLVVKLETQEGLEDSDPAGIVVGGSLLTAADEFRDIPDRIGGALQLIGHPDFPVVMTAISDDFVGAGFTIDGFAQVDTDNDGVISGVITGDDDDDSTGTQVGTLPTGPEVNLGNTIDNDVDPSITGSFTATIGDANEVRLSAATVENATTGQQLIQQDYIFLYNTYLISGNTATALSASVITQPATLIADDRVESRGTYTGPNGTVNWVATSYFINGLPTLFSTLDLDSTTSLGDIRVVSYLDEDVSLPSDDIMYTVGTPGAPDFRVYTIDGPSRVGFSHGGFYLNDGINQNNATYEGWAADQFPQLQTAVAAGTQTFSVAGDIDLADLPQGVDPVFGNVFGPNDVTTAFSWLVNSTATSARVTSFLELLAADPTTTPSTAQIPTGQWNGIVIREGADDRNVAAIAEQEPVRTTVFDTNSFPGQAQFLGELAPDEQSGDENRRLGFIIDGAITTRDDVDVYTFIAESNTEVWLDIDRTSNSLDTVVELIDINGEVLAASNDSLLAEQDRSTGLYISPRLDSDAAQPLTVNEERIPVQRITVAYEIVNATSGNLTFGLAGGAGGTVNVNAAAFNSDPAGSIASALNSTFAAELGTVTTRLLARGDTDDFVVEVRHDAAFFTALEVPQIIGTSNPVNPAIDPMTIEMDVLDSVLQDTYSSNHKDAGMRIRLPGESGTINQYHVRVRSSNTRDGADFNTLVNGDVLGGLTRGRYSLQVRLGETDESAGTQIRLTDVRYATNGVQIIGQPLHSPLTGEEAETTASNETASEAQRLGYYGVANDANVEAGPLQSDRLAKSFAGTIDSATDVDWYQFEVQYENLTRDGSSLLLSTIIDLDYASNFARSDMAFHVFNADGDLIYTATDSNIANDLPASRTDNSTDDLSRGGAGTEDPYLGSVELSEGTYYIAIANQTQIPQALDQFFEPASNNPLVRLEPIRAIDRIAVDDMNDRVLFDESSIVPYSLDDVVMYVNTSSGLFVVNPFTGENYGQVGGFDDTPNQIVNDIYDIAFRANGELQAYTGFGGQARTDTNWNYVQIDTGDAGVTRLNAGAGITTYGDIVFEQNNAIQILDAVSNEGIFVEGISIREYGDLERGIFVGSRDLDNAAAGLQYRTNILWGFDPQTGNATGTQFNRSLFNAGAGTIPREIGQIDTSAPGSARSTQLGVTDVLATSANGIVRQEILDGDVFTLVAGLDTTTFEFDFVGDVAVTGSPVLDGDTLTIGTSVFEYDAGGRMRIAGVSSNGGLDVGQSVTVTDFNNQSLTFEFINQGDSASPGNIGINIRRSDGTARSAGAIANDLALAIEGNLTNVDTSVFGSEIAFNPGTTFFLDGAGLSQIGDQGVSAGNIAIPIDLSFGASDILDATVATVRANGFTVNVSGLTFSVPGASVIAVNSQGLVGGGTPGVTVGRTPILLELTDTAAIVAQKVADAINGLGGTANASAQSRSVSITGGFIATTSGNLVAGGVPQGGTVTGVEFLGNDVYAITDAGGLFRITESELIDGSGTFRTLNRTIGSYVQTATDLLRVGSSFTGLRAGPNSVDGGVYSNVLFGITASGDIYAFNTLGEFLPYFAGGQHVISTGIAGAEGFDFSTLDYNLWHFTGNRSDDAGHGGGTSLAFTYETSFRSNYSHPREYPERIGRRDGQGVNNTYNFPGGAKGQVQSRTFSLENYSPSDVPVLYFNYLIDADGGGSTDSLRVYMVQPDGTEHALALNTLARGTGNSTAPNDEFDDPPQVAPYNDVIDVDKQQLFDNTPTWRQARVSLAEFAGQDNLSLRIEFTTAGSIDTGSTSIRAIAAEDLVEGDSIRVNGETFTVNFPPTLLAPAGNELATAYAADPNARATFTLDGQTYVLNDGTRTVDTSPSNPLDPLSPPNEISIDLTVGGTVAELSAAQVTAIIESEVNATPPVSITPYDLVVDGNRVEFGEATTLTTPANSLISVRNTTASGPNLIEVRAAMDFEAVALATQTALLERFFPSSIGTTSPNYIPTSNGIITLPGLSVSDTGPFANTALRYADQFGSTPVAGSRDNDHEGIYLDDFVIGLAERGERVTDPRPDGAPVDTAFVTDTRFAFPQPDDPRSALVTGTYQVEIRDGSEYIASESGGQFRTFDSNDRLGSGITIQAKAAENIVDGDMFSITDGRATVEFEFDSDNVVTPGRVRIPFQLMVADADTGLMRPQTATEVAQSIIESINRSDVRSVLDVQAVPSSGFENEVVPAPGLKQVSRIDPHINLVGEVVVYDPTRSLASVDRSNLRGDSNRDRDAQGIIMIENSRFLFNEEYGINILHDVEARVAGNDTPSIVRYPRNLIELNTEQLVPGVVVQSNILAFNEVGGIQLQGIDGGADETSLDPVGVERIVNNTIIGGTITAGLTAPQETFSGVLFPQGRISFADRVVSYTPDAGNAPPTLTHQNPSTALGAPDCEGRGLEPVDGQFAVSLGQGGSMTVLFEDNFLTGSGDANFDLVIFETGEIESILVEISQDGETFFDVGVVGGLTNQIDIDQFGFGPNDRFTHVRLTDLRQGSLDGSSLGADIDAVGAISSIPVDQFTPGGIGINIVGGSSPTLLNNIIANSETGIDLTGNNPGVISGGNTYYKNTEDTGADIGLGTLAQVLTETEPVFVSPARFVFSPAAGARIIDSSIDSLPDRASLTTVRNAIGIDPSPVLAPRFDVNGQLRVDDPNVEPPSGLGERVFKDRGGFDRGDLDGPRVTLLSPLAPGIGLDAGRATVLGAAPQAFEIQLVDGIPPADIVPGTGIDDGSVSTGSLILFKDGVPLVEGIDYRFAYNPSNNVIRLTPIAGVWEDDSTYLIRMVDATDAIIRAADGVIYPDGETIAIIDEQSQITTFEYDSGITMQLQQSMTANVADGLQFEVYDGFRTRTFEFDSNDASSPVATRVEIPEAGDVVDFAEALAAAINDDPFLDFTARAAEGTVQLVGGTPLSTAESNPSLVGITGRIGTSTGFGFEIPPIGQSMVADVTDGQTVIVRLGAINEVVFEFDNDGLINTEGATGVPLASNASLDQVIDALVIAIGGSGLGLAPVNAGFGRIFLGGDSTYSLDLSGSNAIQIGLGGDQPTVPIEIPIDLEAEEIALVIQAAIDAENLPGITSSIVDVRVFLEGTRGIAGFGAVDIVVVQDEVGNLLQSNQADGRTELTIFVGTGFDYGDAPAPYISEMADDGPRHRLVPGLSLGAEITADSDAELPNADAKDDGVQLPGVFQAGFNSNMSIYVNNSDAGMPTDSPVYVDAWFDWDQDGQFEASELQRFGTAGTGMTTLFNNQWTTVNVQVPPSALPGQTYARFRLSESAFTGPTGNASSGEVEDYVVRVATNPFQNPSNRYDTNGSNTVTPLDALTVINSLARNAGSSGGVDLQVNPVTSPLYPDVNGDGLMTPFDALAVINELSRIANGLGGEGEQTGTSFVPAGSGVMASGSTVMGDLLIHQVSQDTRQTSESVETPVVSPESVSQTESKVSVFDSAATIELESIVDDLASDTASASESEEDNGLDQFFASLA